MRRSLAARDETASRERQAHDERVLGSGEFVERLWRNEELRGRIPRPVSLEKLLEGVAEAYSLSAAELKWRSKARPIADARAVACYLAVREAGYRGAEIGPVLGLTSAGVSLAIRRGASIVAEDPELRKALEPES